MEPLLTLRLMSFSKIAPYLYLNSRFFVTIVFNLDNIFAAFDDENGKSSAGMENYMS